MLKANKDQMNGVGMSPEAKERLRARMAHHNNPPPSSKIEHLPALLDVPAPEEPSLWQMVRDNIDAPRILIVVLIIQFIGSLFLPYLTGLE